MKKILIGAIALSLAGASMATAQPYDNRMNGPHPGWGQDYGAGHGWRRGERMGYNDWSGAPVVDYRIHRLRHPPRGYEWRESNGRYVMVAIATGVIASIILSNGR
jgi:Ni/Co efflux regulator RcnB